MDPSKAWILDTFEQFLWIIRFLYLLESPRQGDSYKYQQSMFSLRITWDCHWKNIQSANFCTSRIDVITNFAVITNAVIKSDHCTRMRNPGDLDGFRVPAVADRWWDTNWGLRLYFIGNTCTVVPAYAVTSTKSSPVFISYPFWESLEQCKWTCLE